MENMKGRLRNRRWLERPRPRTLRGENETEAIFVDMNECFAKARKGTNTKI